MTPDPQTSVHPSSTAPVVPWVAPTVLLRFGARVLDPQTAVRTGRIPHPTVYLADRLLVRAPADDPRTEHLLSALARTAERDGTGLKVRVSRRDRALAGRLGKGGRGDLRRRLSTRIELTAPADGRAAPPDAWALLQATRADDPELGALVHLDHLMTACAGWTGVGGGAWGGVGGGAWGGVGGGAWGGVGGGAWGGVGGPVGYAGPGYGVRVPVAWGAADPRRTADEPERRPVVVLLDTGIGEHPWFGPGSGVREVLELDGIPLGVDATGRGDPELVGVVTDPLNGMIDRQAGHGTFIAGIVRQRCPEADIWAIPVMPADGAVAESDVVHALSVLLAHQLRAQAEGRTSDLVDVVGLSLGYYHEDPADAADDGPLRALLGGLSEAGVAVVAAAGNDATDVPFFPAALAVSPGGPVPLTSVGALNPDGRSIALFSNNGPWITTHAPGAAVVSTVPVTLSGALTAGVAIERDDPWPRTGIDPDTHRSGFAVWSGTSFAAPHVAGDIAAALLADLDPISPDPTSPTSIDPGAMAARTARAVATMLRRETP